MIPWGLITGFGGSLLSHGIDIWKTWVQNKWKAEQDLRDKQHELAVMDRQFDFKKLESDERLTEIELKNNQSLNTIVYRDRGKTGFKLADGANALIRPSTVIYILTIWGICKLIIYYQLVLLDSSFAIVSLWQPQDQFMLENILGYYFGNRGISSIRR